MTHDPACLPAFRPTRQARLAPRQRAGWCPEGTSGRALIRSPKTAALHVGQCRRRQCQPSGFRQPSAAVAMKRLYFVRTRTLRSLIRGPGTIPRTIPNNPRIWANRFNWPGNRQRFCCPLTVEGRSFQIAKTVPFLSVDPRSGRDGCQVTVVATVRNRGARPGRRAGHRMAGPRTVAGWQGSRSRSGYV